MHLSLFGLTCADSPRPDPSDSIETMQQRLMLQFIRDASFHVQREITNNYPEEDPCNWATLSEQIHSNFQVLCSDGVIEELYLKNIYEPFNLRYVPSTVERFEFVECDLKSLFEIRLLPRAARIVDVQLNRLYGALDFADLPHRMKKFIASANRFTGGVRLFELPETISEIDIAHNPLNLDVLYYGELPEKLNLISLYRCGVEKVRPAKKIWATEPTRFIGVGTAYNDYGVIHLDLVD